MLWNYHESANWRLVEQLIKLINHAETFLFLFDVETNKMFEARWQQVGRLSRRNKQNKATSGKKIFFLVWKQNFFFFASLFAFGDAIDRSHDLLWKSFLWHLSKDDGKKNFRAAREIAIKEFHFSSLVTLFGASRKRLRVLARTKTVSCLHPDTKTFLIAEGDRRWNSITTLEFLQRPPCPYHYRSN